MIRIWPRSLAGQMIALLLLALVTAQAISVFLFLDERRHAVRAADRMQVLSRTLSIVRLLEETPPELGGQIIKTASGPRLRYWLAEDSAVDPNDPAHRDNPLRHHLANMLRGTQVQDVLVRIENAAPGAATYWSPMMSRMWQGRMHSGRMGSDDGDNDPEQPRRWRDRPRPAPLSLTIAVRLADRRWLNAATLLPPASPAWAWSTLTWLALMAVAVTIIVVFSVRRITRPMRALAAAAERLGRGEEVPPLPEEGPREVRQSSRAFNEMVERLQRFVRDRTRMLAAISHDLRTPITSLRLRAEFVEDPEVREKILETLAEMQEMVEAVLSFAREDAAREETRNMDLTALIASLCDDLADGGLDVKFAETQQLLYRCRPVALKRALNNVIINAVAYGTRARVAVADLDTAYEIMVDDDGPGIPEAELDRVFEPFLRLETSRSRDTGGAGLGLAIARSIYRAHGGDIALANRPGGGLRATIRLPKLRQDA
jgi:signal transduction histidine kinase